MDTREERRQRLFRAATELPLCPGVYIMRDKAGVVIYVGKSRALRSRVSQYFANTAHAVKTARMVSCVERFDTIICKTEMEALTLENSLIKQYEPKYNIKLKDAKSYPYIKLRLADEFPRPEMTRRRGGESSKEALYFGPYSSAGAVRDIISSMERAFRLPACGHEFPRDIGRVGSCVYDQMGRCLGICRGNVSSEEYKAALRDVITVLRGDISAAKSDLEARMASYAEEENFEAAARCRDSITALGRLKERQHVVASPETERDVIAYYADPDGICSCAALVVIRGGAVADKQTFEFGAAQLMDENGIAGEGGLTEFVTMLYSHREYIPHEVLVSFALEDGERTLLSDFLTERAGHRVTVRTPERGEGRSLAAMAEENARVAAEQYKSRQKRDTATAAKLAELLSLEVVPERIECYDISNLGGEHITAGMIVSDGGRLKKSDYRLFKIAGNGAPDDYAAMAETIGRRLTHTEWGPLPDLILLDGGAGHVSTIRAVMADAGVSIPVFGMVKDEHHKTRALIGEHEGEEIGIAREQAVFQFIYRLQEEVHRFTISGMKRAKSKTLRRSSLTNVRGIGESKAKALMTNFGTLSRLRAAGVDEIADVPGVSRKNAEDVYDFLHGKEKEDAAEE